MVRWSGSFTQLVGPGTFGAMDRTQVPELSKVVTGCRAEILLRDRHYCGTARHSMSSLPTC